MIPYFYIIKHIPSGKFYAGSCSSKNSDPGNFMKPKGYKTSSSSVHKYIKDDGIDSIEIIQIVTENSLQGITVYEYETNFLRDNNIASNPDWLNCHNNTIGSFSSPEYIKAIQKKYGVDHISKSPEHQKEKKRKENLNKNMVLNIIFN